MPAKHSFLPITDVLICLPELLIGRSGKRNRWLPFRFTTSNTFIGRSRGSAPETRCIVRLYSRQAVMYVAQSTILTWSFWYIRCRPFYHRCMV